MSSCPVKDCGRKFTSQLTMLEHLRRRHPSQQSTIKQNITSQIIQHEHNQQQQLYKLPRLAKLKSKQQNQPQTDKKTTGNSNKKIQHHNFSISTSSRLTYNTNKPIITTKRPSLTKKLCPIQTKYDKFAIIDKQLTSNPIYQACPQKTANQQQILDPLTQTLPNFQIKKSIPKSSSKDKIHKQYSSHQISKQLSFQSKINTKNTMQNFISKKQIQEPISDKKKNTIRPNKKINNKFNKPTSPTTIQNQQQLLNQKVVLLKYWPQPSFHCPSNKIQILYLNNCNLSNIVLNNLQSLQQLSATNNKLQSMQFLSYPKNHNIKILHLDHNQITQLYIPPKIKILTLSFNHIATSSIQDLLISIKKAPQLKQIDLSFNNVRKIKNYKLKIIASCPTIQIIDGLKVTKIDLQLMQQYTILQSKHRGLIPLTSISTILPPSQSPSPILPDKTITQLQNQQQHYQQLIKQTQKQLEIIKQENFIINHQLQSLYLDNSQTSDIWNSATLLDKLHKQCQVLELLNIMQHADEEQLATLIAQRRQKIGLTTE